MLIPVMTLQETDKISLSLSDSLYLGIRKWILKSRKIILLEFDQSQTFSEGTLDPSKTFPITLIRKNNDQLTNQYKVDEILNSRISIL